MTTPDQYLQAFTSWRAWTHEHRFNLTFDVPESVISQLAMLSTRPADYGFCELSPGNLGRSDTGVRGRVFAIVDRTVLYVTFKPQPPADGIVQAGVTATLRHASSIVGMLLPETRLNGGWHLGEPRRVGSDQIKLQFADGLTWSFPSDDRIYFDVAEFVTAVRKAAAW
jgi:hypothetical protein